MYSANDRGQIKKRYVISVSCFAAVLALLLALAVATFCLTDYLNYRYFEIFGGIGVAVFSFLAIFLFAQIKDARRFLLHFDSVANEKEKRIDAEVVSISEKDLTLDDNIRVREISLKQGETTRVYYLLSSFFPCPIKQGRTYAFTLADRFIKGVEDEL